MSPRNIGILWKCGQVLQVEGHYLAKQSGFCDQDSCHFAAPRKQKQNNSRNLSDCIGKNGGMILKSFRYLGGMVRNLYIYIFIYIYIHQFLVYVATQIVGKIAHPTPQTPPFDSIAEWQKRGKLQAIIMCLLRMD